MVTSEVFLRISDQSALTKLVLGGLTDPERPTALVAAFGPNGDDKLHLIDGGLGDRMSTLDLITGGVNSLYGTEQQAASISLAGGSNLFLINLSAPGSKVASGVIFSSFKVGTAKPYKAHETSGLLELDDAGDATQVVSQAVSIVGRKDLRNANGNKDVDISNPGNIPTVFNTENTTGSENDFSMLNDQVNIPLFGFEFASPGRGGDQIFARVTHATENAFKDFESSLFFIQFFKMSNSQEMEMSNKILFSLSNSDKLFNQTVVFMDRLGNETLDQVSIHVYGSKIAQAHAFLKLVATQIITAEVGAVVLSANGDIPDEKVKTWTSYDLIKGENRLRVAAGETITDYNLMRQDEALVETLKTDYEANHPNTYVIDGSGDSGEFDFRLSGGHDGVFDSISPSPFPDEPDKINEATNSAYTADELQAESEGLINSKLYGAYAGSIVKEIADLEICRFNFMVDSGLPYEVKAAMIDLAQKFIHTTALIYMGEDQKIGSFDSAKALKEFRFNAVGDLGDCLWMGYQSVYATNPYAAPVPAWVPCTMDIAYKIGLSYNSSESLSKSFAGKTNAYGMPHIGELIDQFPDRVADEHVTLTNLRVNYYEKSMEGFHMQSDLTNNVQDTRLSLFRNKMVLSIIYIWLYTFLSKKRYGGSALSASDITSITNYGDKWVGLEVITGITVIDVTSAVERENGYNKYKFEIPFNGVAIAYDGEITVKKA